MPSWATFFQTWRFDPVAAAALVIVLAGWVLGVLGARRRGVRWRTRATVGFVVVGLGSYALTSFGFLGAESTDLRWAFTTRVAVLLLVVPALLLLGRPLDLAYASLPPAAAAGLHRAMISRPVRLFGNAIVGPLFACALFCVFLTPLAGAWRTSPVAEGATDLLLPVIGLLFVLPIAAHGELRSEVFLAAEFLIGFLELVIDAIPGLVLRLTDHVVDGVHTVLASRPSWYPSPLADQHLSGDFLWAIAEVADIPILVALFVRWARSDGHRARTVDQLSDAEMDELMQAHLRRES